MSENVLQTFLSVHEQVDSGALSGFAVLQVDLRRLDLRQRSVSDVAFRRVTLEYVSAAESTCRDVRFEASRLRALDLTRSLVSATRIMNCEAHELRMPQACIHHFQVFDTPMPNAVFALARLDDCTFQSAELYGANFEAALLMHCRFSDPRMENASLNRANFRGAVLIDVDLRAANLHGADFSNALLVKVDLRDANLVRANLDGATLVACDITGAVR